MHVGDPMPRGEPADVVHCCGNAPDMHCEHGLIAAVSGGPPGTTYGAKLQVFAAAPRRLSAEVNLSEIVVDDGHRLDCSQGIKLTGRAINLVADKQRLLRCWLPREGEGGPA